MASRNTLLATAGEVTLSGEEGLWDTRRTAEFLNLAVSTLEKDRTLGHLSIPYVKVGAKRVAYRPADVRAWVLSRRRRSTSDERASQLKNATP